ncbi:increased recombination centers protein 6 [[Candida] jaroonii]|uniref:Increased recombination centers protein 6 n=1 Tax=[Candida] jaroonii TaxID=467808 RepID=A0ACA9YDU4_9ASCO|nr:increased recombination centers protein 6 [[Candida] jaroonii]
MIPNHVLILGCPKTGKIRIADWLSEDEKLENINAESHSGLILKTRLRTNYYSTDLNILIDEFPSERSNINTNDSLKFNELKLWYEEFKTVECKELRDVLDGLIFTVNLDSDSTDYISQSLSLISDLKDFMKSESDNDIFFIISAISEQKVPFEDVEDIAISNGLEFIYFNESGTNEFKEKVGKDRIKEILETHEWKNIDLGNDDYENHKMQKLDDMRTMLIESEDGSHQMDFTTVLDKLQIAKGKADSISDISEREKYAKTVIGEIIDYI